MILSSPIFHYILFSLLLTKLNMFWSSSVIKFTSTVWTFNSSVILNLLKKRLLFWIKTFISILFHSSSKC